MRIPGLGGVALVALVTACSFHGRETPDGGVAGDAGHPGIDSSTITGPDARVDARATPDAAPSPPDAFVCIAEDSSSVCVAGGACQDGIDNDGDGNLDCRDPGCTGTCGVSVCCPDGSCATLLIFCL